MITKLGKSLLQGKNILNTPLPVYIFSKETILNRVYRLFHFVPKLQRKIEGQNFDPVLKLAYVASYFLFQLHVDCCMQKPFNPIWGETFQAKIGDMDCALEQTLHKPLASSF
eukprot:CAMPEP_0116899426 /NCGR_PEP_ID=MMETSP0467-20121206/7997_1 /TAXON_ID=283647 /ORGANISM="Mesodinium pulex, Strain SPMC105" /LENGTH=111 /DNA_ID=CAMNT_0004572239 /DNA_START=262 /DNA_END=597 /DNA_ORIENTATION=-